jgi:hypothetical protein
MNLAKKSNVQSIVLWETDAHHHCRCCRCTGCALCPLPPTVNCILLLSWHDDTQH